jgi:hypothetical protein
MNNKDKFEVFLFVPGAFHWIRPPFGIGILLPCWSSVLLTATLATFPWLRWRFSLRTLLIATTLVAVLLGATVYAVR